MHQTRYSVDGSFADAVASLAARYADVQSGVKTATTAPASPSWLTAIGDTVRKDPVARNALLGTAIGGLVGAGSTVAGAEIGPDRKKSTSGLWRNLAAGALAGGAVGGGLGLAQAGLSSATKPVTGVYTDPATGRKMRIDPKHLARNPNALKEIQDLSDPGSMIDQGIYGAITGAGSLMYNHLPVSSVALPLLGLRDLYNNSRELPALVQRTFGRATRGGVFDLNRVADQTGLHRIADVAHIRKGLEKIVATGDKGSFAREMPLIKRILGHSQSDLLLRAAQGDAAAIALVNRNPALQRMFSHGRGTAELSGLSGRFNVPADGATVRAIADLNATLSRHSSGSPEHAEALRRLAALRTRMTARQRVTMHGGLLDQAAVQGLQADAPAGTVYRRNPWTGKVEAKAGGPWSSRGRALPRLAVMAGIPAAEYTVRMLADQARKELTLRERLRQLAQPVE